MLRHKMLLLSFFYLGMGVSTIIISALLWHYFNARTYRIVTFFICIIILSNCLAKLFAIFLFRKLS